MSPGSAGPRLELVKVAGTGGPQHVADILLVLVNEGPRPVEVRAHPGIVPRVFAASGKQVAFMDFRNLAGYAPPALPPPPEAPVRTGERKEVERYSIVRTQAGYSMGGPFGGADLLPGRYRIEAGCDFSPTTREAWVAMHAAAVVRPKGRPKNPQAEAEREADKFAAHFREVLSFFSGHLEAPPLVVELP